MDQYAAEFLGVRIFAYYITFGGITYVKRIDSP